MAILVVGTGALACLFAARLAGSGNNVVMLGSWPAGVAALRQKGVRLQGLDGNTGQYPVDVLEASQPHGVFTHALVLVKAWQTERVADQLTDYLSEDGLALTLQNGYGNAETLAAHLGWARVALGVTTLGAMMVEPGYARHTGQGKLMIGTHPKIHEFESLLGVAGFQVEIIKDPKALLWGKLVINAAINPLTALLRVPNGELLSRPSIRKLLAETTLEAASVAARQGITLPYRDPVEAVEEVARNTSGNISSMLQDVLRGTPTEIDAINGAIIRIGQELGVSTPANHILWELVRGLDYHDERNHDESSRKH